MSIVYFTSVYVAINYYDLSHMYRSCIPNESGCMARLNGGNITIILPAMVC